MLMKGKMGEEKRNKQQADGKKTRAKENR